MSNTAERLFYPVKKILGEGRHIGNAAKTMADEFAAEDLSPCFT